MHNRDPERENHREQRFKPSRAEADWLKEGGREDNWTRVMRSVLRLTGWESSLTHRKAGT